MGSHVTVTQVSGTYFVTGLNIWNELFFLLYSAFFFSIVLDVFKISDKFPVSYLNFIHVKYAYYTIYFTVKIMLIFCLNPFFCGNCCDEKEK